MAHLPERNTDEIVMQGMGVSPGVAVGTVFLMKSDEETVVSRRINENMVTAEIERFNAAVVATRHQIQAIQRDLREHIGAHDACILDVHLMVLDDKVFIEEILGEIRDRRHNAEYAVWLVSDRYAGVLSRIDDDYLRERTADVRDVARRLLRHLGDRHTALLETVPPDSIIVADNLAPSDTALLRRDRVGGLVTDLGSPVSHTAIMARALDIPAVVALHEITRHVTPGEKLLLDGNSGVVVIRPTPERLKKYGALMNHRHRLHVEIVARARQHPAVTTDAVPVMLMANIDGPADLDDVVRVGGEGIGLFRSESLFLAGGRYAAEKEQVAVYRALAQRMHPRPVVVRTLDLGGDKMLPENAIFREDNPFLGCRGIRFCLMETDAFTIQLRALATASDEGNIRVMYPMISDVDELLRANDLLRDVREKMVADCGVEPADMMVGVMVETPAAAICADAIAAHADFISIGSNDLIQYAMAADRGNDRVSHLYQPAHPAILRLIKTIVEAAASGGIPAGICGEMAGDPVMTPLLVGLGLTELSMVPASIPLVKSVIQKLNIAEARNLARDAVNSRSGKDVLAQCREWLREKVPDVYEWVG